MHEISVRIGQGMHALRPLCKRVFHNTSIKPHTKVILLHSLILSRTLYNSATWPKLTQGESSRLRSGIFKIYRAAAGLVTKFLGDKHFSDNDV